MMMSLTGTLIHEDDVVDDGFFFVVEVLPSRYPSRRFFDPDNISRYAQRENKYNIDVEQVVKVMVVMDNEELMFLV
jgi:hypothetical protein